MSTVLLKIELLIATGVRRGGLDGVASVDLDGGCVLRKTGERQVGADHRRRILEEKEKRTFVVPSETILDAPLVKKSLMPILILMEEKVLEGPLLPSTPILPLSSQTTVFSRPANEVEDQRGRLVLRVRWEGRDLH